MPRAARTLGDNEVYHVLNRGNGRAEVFHKPEDFAAFVRLIGEAKERYPVRVIAYCLTTGSPRGGHLFWFHPRRHTKRHEVRHRIPGLLRAYS